MTDGTDTTKPGRWARLLERRQDRRQKRAWRRERRKGFPSVDAAAIRSEQHVHGQLFPGGSSQGPDGSSGG